ncbi:MAG: hypothetical protein U1A27_07045 [Phycisphaerae bacterium]
MPLHRAGVEMASASDKLMFEVYREAGYGRQFRVVFFTELDEHNKESEINRAMAGDHFLDGFVPAARSVEAKAAIAGFLRRLNGGEHVSADEVQRTLRELNLMVD